MAEALTPMMGQYRRIRSELDPDTILFFRLGDFYEMFYDDARVASQILDIALTKRNGVPMCGVPYHAAEPYLAKLLRAGRKVALCDQVEDPAAARGIVRREITRIVTPGTALEEQVLEARRPNYLAGLYRADDSVGLALLELSTGDFSIEELRNPAEVQDRLACAAPAECVVPEGCEDDPAYLELLGTRPAALLSPYAEWVFAPDVAEDCLKRHFGVVSLDGFGCRGCSAAVSAAGAVLHYVTQELRLKAAHVRRLRVVQPRDHMVLDEATVRNLDLVAPRGAATAGPPTTLLGVLDATCTAMGSRLLREWLLRPLAELQAIARRHDAVEAFCADPRLLQEVRETLGQIRDVERLLARLSAGGGNARDVRNLGASLAPLPALKARLENHPVEALAELGRALVPQPDLVDWINRAIVEEPPATILEGGLIREGYHAELDELRRTATEGRQWLAAFQAREQERTGIKSLKVRHNRVFGYYIEVTKAHLARVPPEYERKQTLVSAERFITPELKEYENRILGAQERACALEAELFRELREGILQRTAELQATAAALARLDVLAALADRARALNYVRPRMTDGSVIRIREGRHPILEQLPDAERFVPNDAFLDNADHQLLIITGPNMAGKSTYIRQVALIVIMAHIGSFVPAREAEIALTDRVFTRVGASDDLVRGRSTFLVEMQETANILTHATPRSLIVLDEIGRGTSTFDGISIAWAVAEYLHNQPGVKAKTLFATHFHELTDLARTLPGVKNYNVLVRERGDKVVFLRRIVPGAADKSYGIQVARLAGLPEPVIERAKEILANLEEGEFGEGGQPKLAQHRPRRARADQDQLDLFPDEEGP